ncbi:hypothetical protein SAMN04488072_104268 [Lentibacillus halodurans]|uniref:YwdI family protein n=1 Tax=Lentibacillus halodurans TaxID=237679 RepID=A0A1I0X9S0_9BACI|nr:DUF5327 family protein [Lentibacillus halodurans]SFA97701.1 hypothetical protein SAMN04488072_104268 [Lentibacillus halodurans]
MAVATDTILQKMKRELAEAQQMSASASGVAMKKHIANIQLLCELLLEEQSASGTDSEHDMTGAEMKAMMGEKAAERTSKPLRRTLDHDEANGDSIFDF